ncbi:MAG: glycosyltransferase [Melioribacteraceae bacterium]|nr:glycosyltransferase [Melioribacteraceae bacterium]
MHFLFRISNGIKKVSCEITPNQSNEFVSIIVPFRNEENNLLRNLQSLISQTVNHEQYEIIYVDDNSEDNSFQVLSEAPKPDNVVLLKSPIKIDERAHKKKALQFAINSAKGDIIITTDADCVHKDTWLETMISYFDENTAFVSGPVEFMSNGTLFFEIQKLEFSSLILVGAGLIGIKSPIICNAANLGFRKSVFFEVDGYNDNLSISSGDDEFLMQKISSQTKYNIKFCMNKNAMVSTLPNENISQFYQQRKRWASKGFHYADKGIVIKLILIFLFYLGIPAQLFLGLYFNFIFLFTAIFSLISKFFVEYKIVQIDSNKLFSKTNDLYFILAQILHIPYIIISGISGIFGNYKWKGRDIKR